MRRLIDTLRRYLRLRALGYPIRSAIRKARNII